MVFAVIVGLAMIQGPTTPLVGTVIGEDGQPVAGASVRGEWRASLPLGGVAGTIMTMTGEHGEFTLVGIAPGASITITARFHDRATEEPLTTDVETDQPVHIMIVPRATIAVAGRVLGPEGAPIAGAMVRIWSRGINRDQPTSFGRPMGLEVNAEIRTGPDGRFRTPKELDREGLEYQAEINAEGFHPARTVWLPTGTEDVLTWPELTLRRALTIRDVAGRVVDRAGKPLAGAVVFQSGDGPKRSETTTGVDGTFRLPGVYSGPALVFAEKAGFRFGGAIVGPEAGNVEVRLARMEEPPITRLKTLPPAMERVEERALGRKLIEPVLPLERSGILGYVGEKVVLILARVDPERVLTMIEDRVLSQPEEAFFPIILARFEDDPQAAVALIEANHDLHAQALGFLRLASAVPIDDRDQRAEYLDRALAVVHQLADSEVKLKLLKQVADFWLDQGDLERAAPILREGQAAIAALPTKNYHFEIETFGESLAVIDLPAARALFERKGLTRVSPPDEGTIRRHLGQAAIRVAPFDPAEAERLAEQGSGGPNPGDHGTLLFQIARRMGRADLPRARKLLARSTERPDAPDFARPLRVPYGLGLIASDLAGTDPAKARKLLDEAYMGMLQITREKGGPSSASTAVKLAVLLPTVERIDPDHLAERLWLAASCRPPRSQEPRIDEIKNLATLAWLTARYDRDLADAIAVPVLDRLPALCDEAAKGSGYLNSQALDLLAAYDPRAVVDLISAMPDSARKTERTRNGRYRIAAEVQARISAAEMLGLSIEERRRVGLDRSILDLIPERP